MNLADFYVADGQQRRNPLHLLWCHCLLLIRTLNQLLLPDSAEYRRQMSGQISLLWQRMGPLLEYGFHL